MFRSPDSGLAAIVALLVCAAPVSAQEFRVHTRIYDARPQAATSGKARSALLGTSTSLFHAGKVYDYQGTGSQVTICEPAHEQFVIVDRSRRMLTVIPFDVVENRLFQAGKSAEKKIAELRKEDDAEATKLAGLLEFYLKPGFQETYDEKTRVLKLKNHPLHYEVKCAVHESADVAATYLDFADAMAKLNYLVNEKALLPGPRIKLDHALRRRGLLPVEVTLHSSHENGLHLRAEHRFEWKLNGDDRGLISELEKLVAAGDVKHVTPQQFFEPAGPTKLDARR
jgi:hypothetical protein